LTLTLRIRPLSGDNLGCQTPDLDLIRHKTGHQTACIVFIANHAGFFSLLLGKLKKSCIQILISDIKLEKPSLEVALTLFSYLLNLYN